MDLGIAGRSALVTASSKGLGRASALALAQEGVRVAICARGDAALRAAERELSEHTDVLAIPADVTEAQTPQRLVDATVERFGGLDILVGNAGGPPRGTALEVDDAAIQSAVNDNLLASVRLVRAAVPHMRRAGWGRICLIASFSVEQPVPDLTLSNTARTGLYAWAKTAAADLFADGITLNLACPGLHATERIKEVGTTEGTVLGDPGDFGKVVAFLCSQPAAFKTGTAVLVAGTAVLGL